MCSGLEKRETAESGSGGKGRKAEVTSILGDKRYPFPSATAPADEGSLQNTQGVLTSRGRAPKQRRS